MFIKIIINGKVCNVPPGTTILEAAESAGIKIPGLCLSRDISDIEKHSSSCSVCLVKKLDDGSFVTACDSRICEPLEISASAEDPDVFIARKQSIEMLLSEHIGDCEGPCVISCPFGLDIPEILKSAWKGNTAQAEKLLSEYAGKDSFPCTGCSAPCIKSCRRKQIDSPLDIKTIILDLVKKTGIKSGRKTNLPLRDKKGKFTSVTGRIKNEEEKIIFINYSL